MSLKLYKPQRLDGSRRGIFCGPYCVAAITGASYETIRAHINRARGRPPNTAVKGTDWLDLDFALSCLGYTGNKYPVLDKPTLAQWLKDRPRRHYVLVGVTGHWMLVAGNRVMDTRTGDASVSLKDAPGRRSRVHKVYTIHKKK